MKKRIVCMLLALLLLVGMLPVGVFAEGKTEYEKNETGTAVFNYDLSGQVAYITNDPTLGLNASGDYTITVDVALLSQTFTIADSYVGESGYWYKLEPLDGETMPAKLSAKPWVYQNDIPTGGYADALIITPPANTCRCCESCTGAEDCECGCGECDYCEPVTTDPTTPTDPSQPECGCCESCINAEGCTCGCENCQFCEKEETCGCCESCINAEGCTCGCEACKFCEKEETCGCCENCINAEGCTCGCENCQFYEPEAPEDPESPSVTDETTGAKVYAETLPEGVTLAVDTDVDGSALLSDFQISGARLVFAWDISLRNADNTEYQPGGAMVKIPVNAAAGTKIGLLHKHSGGTSFMGVTEVLPDGTIEFYTDSFSEFAGFTVDFHYNGVDFSIPGLSEIRLSELFEIMEIEENAFAATSVVFSDNSLIGVQQQDNGDWLLTSLESFTTNETLVITFTDGHTIVIDVTDVIYYEGTNGTTYTVPFWNIDSKGVLRIAVNYDSVPMTIYLKKESVLSSSWTVVSGSGYIDKSGSDPLKVDIKTNIPIESNAVDIDLQGGGRVHFDVYRYIDVTYNNGGKNATVPSGVTDMKITTSTNNYTVSSSVPTTTGYTFDYWLGSNGVKYAPGATASLTANTTLTAVWKANTNTAYKVETYQQNLNDNGYTLVSTENKTGTTGASVSASTTAPTGFTYNSTKSTASGNIAANGSLVLKVYYDRNSYTVTTNAGTGISAVSGGGTYKYGASVTINATVSDGYKWKNWTGYNTQTTQNYTFTMPASKVSYTANAEKISYTVTFDMQGATSSSIANKTLTWDEQYTLPTPEKKYTVTYDHNYAVSGTQVKTSDTAQATFLGWADQGAIVFGGKTYSYNGSEADRTKFDAPFYVQPFAVPDKSKDVYDAAGFGGGHYNKYGILKHYVQYGMNEHYTNGAPERKPAPTEENEEVGRYPGGAVVSNLSTTDGYSVPLIAGWSDVSSVTLPTPTRTGYTFGGWYTDAACSDANKVTGTTYTPTSSVTLYAKWTPDTREVTYKYEGTAPSGAPAVPAKANVMPGTSTKVAEVPSLAGYTFSGWNTSDATVSKGSFTMPDKAVTFTGDWSENTYNISYDLDEGELDENDENPATYQADSANFTLHNPKKDGYEFTGWTESISTTNWTNGFINLDTGACETYNAGYPNSVYSEKIFLEAGVTYKLEGTNLNGIRWRYFDTNGNFLGNKSLDDTFTPDVDGYVQILLYEGCTEANRNAAKITSSQGTTVLVKTGSTGDRAYTANWSVNTYTITYNHNDVTSGDPTITTDTYTIEEALTLAEAPTREGYKFTGWELEKAVTEPVGNWDADTYSAAQTFEKGKYGNITLVAQWEEQYRYVLNFDANGGIGAPASITEEWCDDKEHTFTWTEVPTRTGYTFMGWAEDAASEENVAGADKNSIKLDGEAAETVTKTIFAIWKRDTGTIQLNYSGGVPVVVTVTCTDAVNDEEKITINTVVTSNTTIKDLPTGTYKVTAESGNANYTAYVNPGSTLLKSGETANFDLSVSDEGFNWLTGFAHVINKRGG